MVVQNHCPNGIVNTADRARIAGHPVHNGFLQNYTLFGSEMSNVVNCLIIWLEAATGQLVNRVPLVSGFAGHK